MDIITKGNRASVDRRLEIIWNARERISITVERERIIIRFKVGNNRKSVCKILFAILRLRVDPAKQETIVNPNKSL